MPESIEEYFAKIPKEESPEISSKIPKWKEKRALELAKEIKNTPVEDYQKIIELTKKIKALYEKKIIGWHKEGKLGRKDIIAQYRTRGRVEAANFSPEGDKVVIGTSRGKVMVISLTERDEIGQPRVLVEYQAGKWVRAVNFSPEGDKVVIGTYDGKVMVISLTKKDKEGKIKPEVLLEYQAGDDVRAVNFSPKGDKVVIGAFVGKANGKMMVISLTERDEEGNPKVLVEYQAEKWVWAANFSPEGDKVVIGIGGGKMVVISLEKDEEGKIQPRVLVEYQAGDDVRAVNFSPEGDKVVIGTSVGKMDGKVMVISLTKKDKEGKIQPEVLAQYQTVGVGLTVNFSPEGDKVVIGTGDMMRVISLTERDKEGNPKVLAQYQAEGEVNAANFSPEGDKVVIGTGKTVQGEGFGYMIVIG